jgi:hypothetical protein
MLVSVTALVAAVSCASLSIPFVVNEPATRTSLTAADVGIWLATLALLGGSALAAVGVWQHLAAPGLRLLLLIALTVLAAGFIAANAFAIIVSGQPDLPEMWEPAHWLGLSSGVVLYAVSIAEVSLLFLAGRPSAVDAT